ncbi:MAG: hypothetical protein IPG39_12170 [Bacteroidetes bacterium]|nr:hypothetical protein [Bacteroidota bacterium]
MLDSGLGLEAISQLASERDGEEYRIFPAMIHAMICQKDGYVLDSVSTINCLLSSASLFLLSSEEQLRLNVIQLKNFSQVGSKGRILELLKKIK